MSDTIVDNKELVVWPIVIYNFRVKEFKDYSPFGGAVVDHLNFRRPVHRAESGSFYVIRYDVGIEPREIFQSELKKLSEHNIKAVPHSIFLTDRSGLGNPSYSIVTPYVDHNLYVAPENEVNELACGLVDYHISKLSNPKAPLLADVAKSEQYRYGCINQDKRIYLVDLDFYIHSEEFGAGDRDGLIMSRLAQVRRMIDSGMEKGLDLTFALRKFMNAVREIDKNSLSSVGQEFYDNVVFNIY